MMFRGTVDHLTLVLIIAQKEHQGLMLLVLMILHSFTTPLLLVRASHVLLTKTTEYSHVWSVQSDSYYDLKYRQLQGIVFPIASFYREILLVFHSNTLNILTIMAVTFN